MRARTVLAAGLVAVTAVGSLSPALAAPKKKPIKLAWKAQATPDPTSTAVAGACTPTVPSAIHHYTFKVPAAGTLEVALNNSLDWSGAIRTAGGETLQAVDGGSPNDAEVLSVKFKKAQTISIDTCNFAGEPEISPTGLFTFK